MKPDGELEGGEFIQLPGHPGVWYCDSVTGSGAHLVLMSGMPRPITTSKKGKLGKVVTKVVMKHDRNHKVVCRNPGATLVGEERLDMRLMRRRIEMARKQAEGQAETQTEQAPAKPAPVRETQRYTLIEGKSPKEGMKGQGKLVYDTLKAQGDKAVTVGELTKEVVATGQLTTRQDAERVVGFYLSQFKRDGIVQVQKPEPAAAAAV